MTIRNELGQMNQVFENIGAGEGNRTLVISLEGGRLFNINKPPSYKTRPKRPMKRQGVTAEIQNEIMPAVKFNAEQRAQAVRALAYAVALADMLPAR